MRNIVVVTPTEVTQPMVRTMVESLGGYWNAEETLDQGVVERGDAVIYVSSSQDLDPDYDAEDITILTQLLGQAPRAVVDIHLGHATGSAWLAEEVAREVIERWGGFLDDNSQDLTGKAGRGPLETARPPVFSRRPRGGPVVRNRLAHVKPQPLEPVLKAPRVPGPRRYPAAERLAVRRHGWGCHHTRGTPGRGEFAREEDGDGFGDGHVHTREGFWSLLRRGLRPPRGIAPEPLPLSRGGCAWGPNVRKRGNALLGALMEWLLSEDPGIQ